MVEAMQKILVYTDQFSQLHRCIPLLSKLTFSVHWVREAERADAFMATQHLDLFLSDKTSDLEQLLGLLQLARAQYPGARCLVIGLSLSQSARVRLWEAGVDLLLGYVPSWTEIQFLLKKTISAARIATSDCVVLDSQVTYYAGQGALQLPDRTIRFRPKENRIFDCLTQHRSRIVQRSEIIQYVWPDPTTAPNPDTLDVYIRRLRIKLKDWGRTIKTYRGFGYRFELGN